ncbi:MAG: aspartyl/glutamyl-tRNA amidotransferase subunit C, partial [Rickettsiales bacterium]|nr:aspartyl/glutamyl-tRNA amidotransferase subunit C [Rickettsiales bacterium]
MTQLTNEDIKKIAKLACIEVSEDDYKTLTAQVGGTISWIEQLNEANTDG